MIRVEFTNSAAGQWAHEMTTNHEWLKTLRSVGVPVVGRLAFTGVQGGELKMTANRGVTEFVYREHGEHPDSAREFKQTHTGKGHTVYMSGRHLAKHEEDDEL